MLVKLIDSTFSLLTTQIEKDNIYKYNKYIYKLANRIQMCLLTLHESLFSSWHDGEFAIWI